MYGVEDEANAVISIFREAFDKTKTEPIVFYGIGVNTRALIKEASDYNVVGVMDAKHEGEYFEGIYIYSEKEVTNIAKRIVIVARAEVLPIIYNRIKHLEELGITIYDVAGKKLNERKEEVQPVVTAWQTIALKVSEYDVISFDIFDTLINRKVVFPEDIFDIVALRLQKAGVDIPFKKMRMNAERKARKKLKAPTIYDIYRELQTLSDRELDIEKLIEIELGTEEEYCTDNPHVLEILNYARTLGKKIFLVSEMYLVQEQLERLLKKCNIADFDELIISCEHQKNKWPNGDLYEIVKEKAPMNSKILHIGDNEGADVQCAKKHGLAAIKVWSNYEVLVRSPYKSLLSYNKEIGDSIALGMFMVNVLSRFYEVKNEKGMLGIKEERVLGYIGYGALVSSFLAWVCTECKKRKITSVAFIARDGWVLDKAWRILQNRIEEFRQIHEEYVLGSRRALVVPSVYCREDINKIVEKTPSTMANASMLKNRFGLEKVLIDEDETKLECALRYEKEILENAAAERKQYNDYIEKKYQSDWNIAVVDAVSSGTIAESFFKTTKREGTLLSILLSSIPDYSVYDEFDAAGFLGEDSKYAPKWMVHRDVGSLESVLTAPYPMFCHFDIDGNEVFSELELSQQNEATLIKIQKGIEDYVEELSDFASDITELRISPELCDAFFGILYSENIEDQSGSLTKLGVTNGF